MYDTAGDIRQYIENLLIERDQLEEIRHNAAVRLNAIHQDLVYCQEQLRRLRRDSGGQSGGSLWDAISHPIDTIKEAISGPTKYNNVSSRTIEKYGNVPIVKVAIARTPLVAALETAINTISLGKFKELKNKYGHNTLYHASLVLTLENGEKVLVEKNESITIEPLKDSSSVNKNTEYMDVPFKGNHTLNSILLNGQNILGDDWFKYSGLDNNCQLFVRACLQGSGMLNPGANQFIFQDMTGIKEDLNNFKNGYVEKVMNAITSLGTTASILRGKGKINEHVKKLYSAFEKAKFRFL